MQYVVPASIYVQFARAMTLDSESMLPSSK